MRVPQDSHEEAAEGQERAVHRLKSLGIVEDYLVDFGGRAFELLLTDATIRLVDERLLEFVRRTLPGRVPHFEALTPLGTESPDLRDRIENNVGHLIEFVYETVVNARRRALEEMVRLADEAEDDAEIRSRTLRYLELGRVAGELDALMDLPRFTFDDWQGLYSQLDTVDDAREWRGATARLLESAPDHPGLLVGRAIAEATVPGGEVSTFSRSLLDAFVGAGTRYALPLEEIAVFAEWLVGWMHERRRAWVGLTLLTAERVLGPMHGQHFLGVEERILKDRRSEPSELGVVLVRRMDRYTRWMTGSRR